jgi:hypothetical protein
MRSIVLPSTVLPLLAALVAGAGAGAGGSPAAAPSVAIADAPPPPSSRHAAIPMASSSTSGTSGGGAAASGMLNVLDFGAVADGVTDCAAAMQRAINQAQYEHRALQVPAGIYRVDSGLVVNTTQHSTGKYSPSTQHWQVAPLRLLGEGSNNGGGESVIFAGQPMAAVLTFASRQPGTLSEMDEGNATTGHAVEQLTLDANELANFSAFAPAIWGAQWKSVSFRHGLIAGLYIGYGWIHTIEDCAFKNNAVANLYLDRAINAVNVLNNNFAASAGVGIIANGGEALRIVGNCFQSLATAGPLSTRTRWER